MLKLATGLSLTASQVVSEATPITSTTFGALTAANAGATDVTAATDGTYGQFTASGGVITPNTSPLTVGTVDVGGVSVTVEANKRTVNGTTELIAAMQAEQDGATIEYRRSGTYGEINLFNRPRVANVPSGITVQPCSEAGSVPGWDWQSLQGNGETVGNVTFNGVLFARTPNPIAHDFVLPNLAPVTGTRNTNAQLVGTTSNVTYDNCTFDQGFGKSAQGQLLVQQMTCLKISKTADGTTVNNSHFQNFCTGIEIGGTNGTYTDMSFRGCFNDFIRIEDCNTNIIKDPIFHEIIGWGPLLHQDVAQGIGTATNLTIEAPIVALGDYLNNTLCQPFATNNGGAGDMIDERIAIAASTTLSAATHMGRVAQTTADALTLTLPASPTLGDTYYFRVANFGQSMTVEANAGQTHGAGLLPRTVDDTQNHRTFMVYWDGSQWQTEYGLRAGFVVIPAGNVTLTGMHHGTLVAVDASNGPVNITLPDFVEGGENGFEGIGIARIDSTSNPVTITRDASDSWVYASDGSAGPASLSLTQTQAWCVRAITGNQAANTWEIYDRGMGELQGFFSNAKGHTDIIVRGGVFELNSSHHHRLEETVPGLKFENCTYLLPSPANEDGWLTFGSGSNAVRTRGNGAQSYVARIFTMGAFDNDDVTPSDPTPTADVIALDMQDRSDLSTAQTYIQIPDGFYNATPAEVLNAARATVSGPLDGTWIGAVGTTTSNGFYDFVNKRVNPLAPAVDTATLVPAYNSGTLPGPVYLGGDVTAAGAGARTYTISTPAAASGNTVVVAVCWNSISTFTSVTVNGLTPTQRGSEYSQSNTRVRLYDVAIDTAGAFDVVVTMGGGFGSVGVQVYDASTRTFSSVEAYQGPNPSTSNSIAVTSSEAAGQALMAFGAAQTSSGTFSAGTNLGTVDLASDVVNPLLLGALHEDEIMGGAGTTYAMSFSSAFVNSIGVFGFYG